MLATVYVTISFPDLEKIRRKKIRRFEPEDAQYRRLAATLRKALRRYKLSEIEKRYVYE